MRSGWLVETWRRRCPTVDEARPEFCRGCSRIHGVAGYVLRGHGCGTRRVLGPLASEERPAVHRVPCRIYFCPCCTHRTVVVPCEHSGVFRYAMTAIVAGLAMWGLERRGAGAVRDEISPLPRRGFGDPRLWASLHRWVRERDRLWPTLVVRDRATHRETAAAIVGALTARLPRAPPSPRVADAFDAARLR